jgi:hypothetical protein
MVSLAVEGRHWDHPSMRSGGRRRLGLVVGGIGLLVLLAVVGLALWAGGLSTASDVGQLVSVVLAVVIPGVGLWLWARKPGTDTTDEAVARRGRIVDELRARWTAEAGVRGLNDRFTMPVRWGMVTDRRIVDDPARVVGAHVLAGDARDIAQQLPATGRLVVLGAAGAGKSTLALQLLLELLPPADGVGRVPVSLSLASWDENGDLRAWLRNRLDAVHPDAAALPVEQFLPIVDGLDEVPVSSRRTFLAALNRAVDVPVVLTCRTVEYVEAVMWDDVLTSAAVITPAALTADSAADHLCSALPPSVHRDAAVRALRSAAAPLTEVAATPLGLWLLREAVRDRFASATAVDWGSFESADALRDYLFDQLVPALLRNADHDASRRRRPRDYSAEDVRGWLTVIADLVRTRVYNDRNLAWWSLAEDALPRRLVPVVFAVVALILAACAGYLVGIVYDWNPWLAAAIAAGLGAGAGWLAGVLACDAGEPEPVDTASGRAWARAAGFLLAAAVAGGLAMVVLGWLHGYLRDLVDDTWLAWVARLLGNVVSADTPTIARFGAGAALAMGAISVVLFELSWSRTPPARFNTTPHGSWNSERRRGTARAVVLVVAGALYCVAYLPGPSVLSAVAGALIGLVVGVGVGCGRWSAAEVAATYLAVRRHLPWRLMSFLNEAYRLGLLRAVGPIYQFRHAEFQDHLLRTTSEPSRGRLSNMGRPPPAQPGRGPT